MRGFTPLGDAFLAKEQRTAHRIVPIGKDIRLDHHLLSHGALDRESASVDLREDSFNDNPRSFFRVHLLFVMLQLDPHRHDLSR